MIETTRLPEEIVERTNGVDFSVAPTVEKRTLSGIDEIQCLHVYPRTSIKRHGHENQWEVWVHVSQNTAYICLHGEEHELANNTDRMLEVMAIKGHIKYTYNELEEIFVNLGFSVVHGSMLVN